jgi:hypothetical protein
VNDLADARAPARKTVPVDRVLGGTIYVPYRNCVSRYRWVYFAWDIFSARAVGFRKAEISCGDRGRQQAYRQKTRKLPPSGQTAEIDLPATPQVCSRVHEEKILAALSAVPSSFTTAASWHTNPRWRRQRQEARQSKYALGLN